MTMDLRPSLNQDERDDLEPDGSREEAPPSPTLPSSPDDTRKEPPSPVASPPIQQDGEASVTGELPARDTEPSGIDCTESDLLGEVDPAESAPSREAVNPTSTFSGEDEPVSSCLEDPVSSDDDFGSFDEASGVDDSFEEPVKETSTPSYGLGPSALGDSHAPLDLVAFVTARVAAMESPQTLLQMELNPNASPAMLLNDRSQALYTRLSTTPRLTPIDWKKANIRRRLMVNLNLPIDLGESGRRGEEDLLLYNQYKTKTYPLPTTEHLGLSAAQQQEVRETAETRIAHAERVSLTAGSYLDTLTEEGLIAIEAEMASAIRSMEEVNAVWLDRLTQLQLDNAVYEGVVESVIGHTQKLSREEIFKRVRQERGNGLKGGR